MIYLIRYPEQVRDHKGGIIDRWLLDEGEKIGFGTDLFDVMVTRIVVLQRTGRADLIAKSRRSRQLRNDYEEREMRRVTKVRVTSTETGAYLREIIATADTKVSAGDVVALATTTPDEEYDSESVTDTAELRAIVNVFDPTEIEEDDGLHLD